MMKTVLNPETPRVFRVGEDDKEAEEITAPNFLRAFSLWYRLNGGKPAGLEIEIGGGASNVVHIWVADTLYKIEDITEFADGG